MLTQTVSQSALTAAERQRRSRAARAQSGGQTITVTLSAAATAKLAAHTAKGETATAVINRLLAKSRP